MLPTHPATTGFSSPWLVSVVALAGLGLGLLVVITGIKPAHKDFAASEVGKRWGLLSAVAVAQGFGVTAAVTGRWVQDAFHSGHSLSSVLGLLVIVVIGAGVAAGSHWVRSHGRGEVAFPSAEDYPVDHFVARQALVVAAISVPTVLALSGLAAAATVARTVTTGGSPPRGQVLALISLWSDFSLFLAVAAFEVVVAMLLTAIARSALLQALPSDQHHAYDESDPFLLGGLLSLGLAIITLPSYVLLHAAGQQVTQDILARRGFGTGWFELHERLQSALVPSVWSTAQLSAVLAVLAPVLTGALSRLVRERRSRPDTPTGSTPEKPD